MNAPAQLPKANFGVLSPADALAALSNIPEELRLLRQWCVCTGSDPDAPDYRRPYNPRTLLPASTKDASTWGTWEEAHACVASGKAHSLGLVLTHADPYCVIDLDQKTDRPVTQLNLVLHQQILEKTVGYAEVSHSGTGYHVLCRATNKDSSHGKRVKNFVELFFHTSFIRLSGWTLQGRSTAVEVQQTFIDNLVHQMPPAPCDEDIVIDGALDPAAYAVLKKEFDEDPFVKHVSPLEDNEEDGSKRDFMLALELCKMTDDNAMIAQYMRDSPRGQRIRKGHRETRFEERGYLQRTLAKARGELVQRSTVVAGVAPFVVSTEPLPPPLVLQLDRPPRISRGSCYLTSPGPVVSYVMEPLLPRRYTALLGGHGGSGKSYLALVLAAHVAAGRPWAGFATSERPVPVVFVSFEDETELIQLRMRAIVAAYGLDRETVGENLCIADYAESARALVEPGAGYGARAAHTPAVARLLPDLRGAGLIIVDNASEAFAGDENNRRDVGVFMGLLGSIARTLDACVLLLVHVDKATAKFGAFGNSYTGSTAWNNKPRSRMALTDVEGKGLVFTHEKNNLGKRAEVVKLFRDADGVPIPGQLAMMDTRVIRAQMLIPALVEAVKELNAGGQNLIHAISGSNTTWRALQGVSCFSASIQSADKDIVEMALNLAVTGNYLQRVEIKNAQRKLQSYYILPQQGGATSALI